MSDRGTLLRTQAFERYLQQHGSDLKSHYHNAVGSVIQAVHVYVDPQEGKLRVDIETENGVTIPTLADVSPDWEETT